MGHEQNSAKTFDSYLPRTGNQPLQIQHPDAMPTSDVLFLLLYCNDATLLVVFVLYSLNY